MKYQTPKNGNYFTGYYDRDVFSSNGSRLLVCRADFTDRIPQVGDALELGYVDWKENNRFQPICKSYAWNWQQGCMLQWYQQDSQTIIYNTIIDRELKCNIAQINGDLIDTYDIAYYSKTSDNKFLFCIDNNRHYHIRSGYRYALPNPVADSEVKMLNDGIWRVNTHTHEKIQIIKISELIENNHISTMDGAVHYVEHIMPRPDNQRLAFLHRWKRDGCLFTRLYTCSLGGDNLFLINDSGRVTHYNWVDNTLIYWGANKSRIQKLREVHPLMRRLITTFAPIYRHLNKSNSISGNNALSTFVTGDSYYLQIDQTRSPKLLSEMGNRDGHPRQLTQNILLLDTYPDPAVGYNQSLYTYNLDSSTLNLIATHRHDPNMDNTALRSDLHPKASSNGRYCCVDTLTDGVRSVTVYEL